MAMKDERKTKKQLIEELEAERQQRADCGVCFMANLKAPFDVFRCQFE